MDPVSLKSFIILYTVLSGAMVLATICCVVRSYWWQAIIGRCFTCANIVPAIILLVELKSTEWALLPNYIGKRITKVRIGRILPEIRAERMAVAVLVRTGEDI